MTTARILTGGKVSKKLGRSVSVAIVEGLPGGRQEVTTTATPPDSSPTVAQMRAAALGIAFALHNGATRVEVITPSKRVAKAINSEPGGGIDDYFGCLAAGWAIYWTRDRCPDGWTVDYRPAKETPGVDALAARVLERSEENDTPRLFG